MNQISSNPDMVRLIKDDGTSTVISLSSAHNMANSRGLDLVVIDENVSPPAVKILDHGKFIYEQNKKKRAAAKTRRETQVRLKEIQMRPVTGENDVRIKAKNARRFLDEGNQVKITIKYRGRELNNQEPGNVTIGKFLEFVGEHRVIQDMTQSGRDVTIVIAG